MTEYTFDAALIATLTETIVTSALSEGYADQAILGDWSDYELAGGDLEYLRGEHDDSPAEVAALSPDAYDALCDRVGEEVAERLRAAVSRRAREIALAEPALSWEVVNAACRWLSSGDEDSLRGEVYALAEQRLATVVAAEAEALAPGEALCWSEDAHRERGELDDDGEVVGTYTDDLTDRDYLIARDYDGALVWGERETGGTCDVSDLLDGWIRDILWADALTAALLADTSDLHVLTLAGSRTHERREGRLDALREGWDEVVTAEGASHLAGGGGIVLDPRDADDLADDDAARECGRRMARAHLESVRR